MPLPLLIPAALQAGIGIYQALSGNSQAKKADKAARASLAASPQYEESPYTKALLADTQSRLGAVSPAVMAAYRNASQQAINQQAVAQRNAASGAEAIAAGAVAQGQVNNVLPTLAGAQQQFDTQNRGMYYNALENSTNERDKVFNDRLRRNMDMRNYYLGRTAAGNRNLQSGINAAASGIAGLANSLPGMGTAKTVQPAPDYSQYGGLDANGLPAPSNSYGTPSYMSSPWNFIRR